MPGQMLNATVTASSRFQTPDQFRNIIVKAGKSYLARSGALTR